MGVTQRPLILVRHWFGDRYRRRPESVNDAVFTPHVMRFRQEFTLWRSTNDKLAAFRVNDEVGEVRMTALKSGPCKRAGCPADRGQPCVDSCNVESGNPVIPCFHHMSVPRGRCSQRPLGCRRWMDFRFR